ncbi:MAG: beta-hexosaminidase, partial [Alphaproteobacteria bacterium]|nr:beta-hexosaminidase [Alphaproteobacteria bacterium]
MTSRQAAIYGLSGPELTPDEIDYISKVSPLGFILFSRNINNLQQVSKLVSHLKSFAQNDETLILIDQEGGRVARLRPPLVRDYPTAKIYGKIYNSNPENALRAAYLGAVLMA